MTLSTAPVPGLSDHQMLLFLLQLSLLITAATLLGRVAARLNMPPVVGELACGVVLGPSLFGNVAPGLSAWLLPRDPEQTHLLNAVSQLGVLLLVAITGAHIDLGLLRRERRTVGLVSVGSVLLPLALGFALGLLLPVSMAGGAGGEVTFALFIGVAVAVSALPVIAKTLLDMGLLHRDVGQMIVGSAAVSDIVGWLLLSVVSAMATHGLRAGVLAESAGCLLLVLAATVLVLRPLAARVLRPLEHAQPGLGLSAVVVLILLSAAGTHALGMEPVLGAFLCGIVVGSLGGAGRRSLDSLRTFVMATLAPLFLAASGLQVDLTTLARPPVLLAAVVTLAVAVGAKFAGGYLGARAGRLGHTESVAIGAGLNARGLVEIVLASVGLSLGVLNTASYTVIVLVAVVTSVMAPPVLRHTTSRIATTPAEAERQREFTDRLARAG
ncbi:cation:proton antiporter [Streptomyces malaysiense]|uniref:Cation/H(+) antiporter n=1 Tax=Streptomyces malaysiense TaxID=1428626 RepID=A0A1J4Q7T6_9ACTN|nr:cation:proton antiporter [Streptomyces malaysiense]OIK28191.1 cation/H(+) antiporter [Streptomyces malaysiense]